MSGGVPDLRVQRYDFFLNHQNFSIKKSLFSCIFYALLIYVNTQNGLHLIIYYIGRTVFAKSQEQRIELQTQEKPNTPFWLVISSILLFTGCAAGILFIKKTEKPANSQLARREDLWDRGLFTPSEIAVFLDITLQNLYSRRKQLLKSVFNIVGKPEKFDNLLQERN